MLLLLVRHGNTFNTDETPTYVGARTDLPLTITGQDQAEAWAKAMDAAGLLPARVLCSTLQRTIKHMEPMTRKLGMRAAEPDKRLNEMDYGTWENKSNDEVDAMYGSDAVRKAWDKEGKRPDDAGFLPSEMDLAKNIAGLVAELQANHDDDKIVVICSSNGIIRYFLKLVPGAYESAMKNNALKVGTGSVSAIDLPREGKAKVLFWNKKPADAPLEDI